MPFPLSGPSVWRPEEPQQLWAWSSEPGDARAGGPPLPKGTGTGLYAGLRAGLPPLALGGGACSGQECTQQVPVLEALTQGVGPYGLGRLAAPVFVPHPPSPVPVPALLGRAFWGSSFLILLSKRACCNGN